MRFTDKRKEKEPWTSSEDQDPEKKRSSVRGKALKNAEKVWAQDLSTIPEIMKTGVHSSIRDPLPLQAETCRTVHSDGSSLDNPIHTDRTDLRRAKAGQAFPLARDKRQPGHRTRSGATGPVQVPAAPLAAAGRLPEAIHSEAMPVPQVQVLPAPVHPDSITALPNRTETACSALPDQEWAAAS